MRCLIWAVAAAGLLASARAQAGPIQWSYSAAVSGETGQTRLDLGTQTLWTVNPTNGDLISSADYYITAPLPGGMGSTVAGSQQGLRIGNLGHQTGAEFTTEPPGQTLDQRFRVNLEIVDLASGQTGSAEFLGTVGIGLWRNEVGSPYEYSIGLEGSALLVLGANWYQIEVNGGFSEDNGTMSASVTVGPMVPEPTSLTLAGLGLVGGWVHRRRSRAVCRTPLQRSRAC